MSGRAAQWEAIEHGLTHTFRQPMTAEAIASILEAAKHWQNLDELVTAVEKLRREGDGWPPSANEVINLTRRLRRDAKIRRERGERPPCPTCGSDGFVQGPPAELYGNTYETLTPCPQCRPGTFKMHAAGHYEPDRPIGDESLCEEMGLLNASVRFGPPVHGDAIANPFPAATESPQ